MAGSYALVDTYQLKGLQKYVQSKLFLRCLADVEKIVPHFHAPAKKSGVNCTEICHCLEEECENKDMDFGLYCHEASESD